MNTAVDLEIKETARFLATYDWWVELPSWPRLLSASDIIQAIRSVVNADDIEAVAFFGSSVRPLRRRAWFFKQWAHDVDIMVLSRRTSAKAHGDENYVARCSDGYGTWRESRVVHGTFDVVVVTAAAFADAARREEKIACDVLKEGVILVGEWPAPATVGHDPYRNARAPSTMRRFERDRNMFRIENAAQNKVLIRYQVT